MRAWQRGRCYRHKNGAGMSHLDYQPRSHHARWWSVQQPSEALAQTRPSEPSWNPAGHDCATTQRNEVSGSLRATRLLTLPASDNKYFP